MSDAKNQSPGFCELIHALAHRPIPGEQSRIGSSSNLVHAPDAVLRAYSDLIREAFTYIRQGVGSASDAQNREIHDLADAMHNISGILVNYGSWTDDEKYRRLYLRRYDQQWAQGKFGLEQYIATRVTKYSEGQSNHENSGNP